MKNHKNFLLMFLVIISISDTKLFSQDPITEYEGIPLVIYPGINVDEMSYPLHYQQMDSMGVFGSIGANVLNESAYLEHFSNYDLKVIPQYLWGNENVSYILRYTDSHYTVWEAEGTDAENGNAALFYDTVNTTYFSETYQGEIIQGRWAGGSSVSDGDTIIYGPGYSQNANYAENLEDTVFYTAEFRMKILERDQDLPQDYLNDIVCKIMVTETDTDGVVYTIDEREIKVSDFNGWNNWDTLNITRYNVWDNSYDLPEEHREMLYWRQKQSYYTEFKVVWAGLDYVNLYIDRIIVSDEKGRLLVNTTGPITDIATLVNTYLNHQYGETIIGWYAVDEPSSIDNYEPFRIVDHIINSVSLANDYPLRLHTGIASGWNGKFGSINNGLGKGTHLLYRIDEFWLRAKPKNLQMNLYNYNYPWKAGEIPEWREANIAYVTDLNLDRINNYDTSFAFSTQSGKYDAFVGSIIPSSAQINYHVNLGLMYGAKELRLDPFFSSDNGEVSGLIDENEEETENYYFFKDLLIPRLNGLLGKTLRQIHQMAQYPNINPSVSSDLNINTIKKIKLDYPNVTEAMPSYVDLGFFSKEGFEPNRYFMIINRYYSDSLLNKFKIDFRNLSGIYNWSLMNYVDSSNTTIIADAGGFVTSPQFQINRGDAILFSLFPVAEFGGKLLVSENVGDGMTLMDDMTIESGATLSVYGTYNAKANIIVKSGGRINNYENGKIIFDPNKGLIIEGSAQVYGVRLLEN